VKVVNKVKNCKTGVAAASDIKVVSTRVRSSFNPRVVCKNEATEETVVVSVANKRGDSVECGEVGKKMSPTSTFTHLPIKERLDME
jgi:hypothetical protein